LIFDLSQIKLQKIIMAVENIGLDNALNISVAVAAAYPLRADSQALLRSSKLPFMLAG